MRLRNLRPTPGVLIGTIALVFAMTGGAIAHNGKVDTNDIKRKAVTAPKIARDAVKSGKIIDGKVKRRDLADNVVPEIAHGRVNKEGNNVTVAAGSKGIAGAVSGGEGVICYDLAKEAVSGTANAVADAQPGTGATVEVHVNPPSGCTAPHDDAVTVTQTGPTGENRDVYVQFMG